MSRSSNGLKVSDCLPIGETTLLRNYVGSKTGVLKFLWRGTTISLVMTSLPGEKRCLTVNVDVAGTAERTADGTTATFIIASEVVAPSVVLVPITCSGPAPNAIEKFTSESNQAKRRKPNERKRPVRRTRNS